jgi:hypothetical protein
LTPILKAVLKSAHIDYNEFAKELPKKFADQGKMKSLHVSANPHIPKNPRIDFIKASKDISEKILPHL